MIKKYYTKYLKFKDFLGPEVWRLFLISASIGFFWFFIESSFVFVLQGFLRAIGLLESKKTFLPDFYPSSALGAISVLLLFGFVRSNIVLMKKYYNKVTRQAFMRSQREKIIEYSLTNTDNVASYDVLNVFRERVSQAGTVVGSLAGLINIIISSTLLFLFGMKLAPIEMMIGLFCLIIMVLPFQFLNKKIKDYGKAYVEESTIMSKIMLVSLKNYFLLRIYDQTQKEITKGKNAARRFETLFNKFTFVSSFKAVFPQFSGTLIISVLCFVSLTYLETSGAKLLSFFYIFMRMSQGLGEGSSTFSQLRFNFSNFNTLYSWHLKCEDSLRAQKIEKLEECTDCSFIEGVEIEVNNLHFSYDGIQELFKGLSLKVGKGKSLLLKGQSGSGKSTLLTLLLGLAKPKSGAILINGKDACKVRKLLANHVAYVGPDPYLVMGTVKDNLLYGHYSPESVSEEQMWIALERAQLDGVVRKFEHGLNRVLREVTELSTGQKQRLSIARALVRNPKLLVLDEATANLDGKTEDRFVSVLEGIKRDMTTLIVSHKNSFDRVSDIVINLEEINSSSENSMYA